MYAWIEKQPIRFLSISWFVSFIVGWLMVMLIDFVIANFIDVSSGNISPSLIISLSLFGFTIAGFLSGIATASLVRVHQGEISQTSFNLIVFAWTVAVTGAAMLYFLIKIALFQ
jgi:hypothetical protein